MLFTLTYPQESIDWPILRGTLCTTINPTTSHTTSFSPFLSLIIGPEPTDEEGQDRGVVLGEEHSGAIYPSPVGEDGIALDTRA